jgi:LuxR family transcriptional regulator, maltose regulon positive regulatory protein
MGSLFFMTESTSPAEILLHTKLMLPRLHSSLVIRQELMLNLDKGLTKKLSLVTAPTGFGKTTLVSMWIAERSLTSAWVTLDEYDNDPVRFWTYVITALRSANPNVGKNALSVLMTSQPISFQSILTPLINDLAQLTQPCVLVLEDYHVITTPEIHKALMFLIQNLPTALHMLVISRIKPDLSLGILRARDDLLEIDTLNLRFSKTEAKNFLNQNIHVELPPLALDKLYEQTEGWAAGLRLAALSLQNQNTAPDTEKIIQSFSGSHRYVADYLIGEVFENQPRNIQGFLLKTCFLPRLTGSLCNSILEINNAEILLEQVEKDNLFLVRLEHRHGQTWYRYYPFFAESIQSLAALRLGEAGIQSIFEKASAWYEYHQLYDDAIETALKAKQFERALDLVEKFIEIYNLTELHTLTRWMEQIPEDLTRHHPEVCLAYAQVILFTSDRFAPATAQRMEPYLQAAEAVWQADGNEGKIGGVLALRGMMLIWQGDLPKALQNVHQSLEKLPENEVFWRGISLLNSAAGELYAGNLASAQDQILEGRALLGASQNVYGVLAASQMLSDIFYWQGDHEQAAQVSRQILTDAVGSDSMLDDQGNAHLSLANIAYEQNDLQTAEQNAAQALVLANQRDNEELQVSASIRIAQIHAARGEPEQGQGLLKTLSMRIQNQAARRSLQNAQAHLALWAGKLDTLSTWWDTTAEAPQALFLQKEQESFIQAHLWTLQGKTTEAIDLLEPLKAHAFDQGRARSQVEALCLEACAFFAAGVLAPARQALIQALQIGKEKGFCRIFVDHGQSLASLLQGLMPGLTDRSISLYGATLLRAFKLDEVSPLQGVHAQAFIEPLSQQEIRVLRLLAGGMSNSEIAGELVVSNNTVKTHIKNIYRKLNINSRDMARVVAKELKLL